jgi:photosystem II PsbY protein
LHPSIFKAKIRQKKDTLTSIPPKKPIVQPASYGGELSYLLEKTTNSADNIRNIRLIDNSLQEVLRMDWRVLVVLSPLLLAAGWAVFNIGKAALQQVQGFLKKQS